MSVVVCILSPLAELWTLRHYVAGPNHKKSNTLGKEFAKNTLIHPTTPSPPPSFGRKPGSGGLFVCNTPRPAEVREGRRLQPRFRQPPTLRRPGGLPHAPVHALAEPSSKHLHAGREPPRNGKRPGSHLEFLEGMFLI